MGEIEKTPNQRVGLWIVLAGVLVVNLWVWNANVPIEDDCSHVSNALRFLSGGRTTYAYELAYAALLATVAPDPIRAHVILRVLTSVMSTLGLYLVLRTFRRLRCSAAVIACLVWAGSFLCMPVEQDAGASVFSFGLTLLGLAYFLRRPSAARLLVFSVDALWVAQGRPEYLAPLLLMPVGAFLLLRARRREPALESVPARARSRLSLGIAGGLLALSLVASPLLKSKSTSTLTTNSYLLLGLGQCYAVYYRAHHPEATFSPMIEYKPLLNRVFGNPHSFTEAMAHNPVELGRYVARNTLSNLVQIPRGVLHARNKIYSALTLSLIVVGTILCLLGILRSRYRSGSPAKLLSSEERARLLTLVLFASGSSCAVVLLIPNSRYWVAWAPLLYLWLAWAIHAIISRWPRLLRDAVILPVAFAVFAFPVLWNTTSNQGLFHAVRDAAAGLRARPNVAGVWVLPYTAFALRDNATPIGLDDGLSVEQLVDRRYDMFFLDGLGDTDLGKSQGASLRRFVSDPGAVGYRVLPAARPYGLTIYVREPSSEPRREDGAPE